jgi:LPXTG-motif cell wall-anchored protein
MKKLAIRLIWITIVCLLQWFGAMAQENNEPLVLDFNRDFGYGGFGGEIQGRFSLKVRSPEDLVRVIYYLDDEVVFDGSDPPFLWQFNTANYPDGRHTFKAVGYRGDGSLIEASPFTRVFLSSEDAWGKTGDMLVPVLVIVGLATVGGAVGAGLLGRKKKHVPGVYGVVAGGAICPRCSFPYARSLMAPNLLVGKLSRCPHCGKWAVVAAASKDALAAAEARLVAENQGAVRTESDVDKLRQQLDESRFDD